MTKQNTYVPVLLEKGIIERPTRQAAEAAIRTLIQWLGDDPRRAGVEETPRRVLDTYAELFGGYKADQDPLLDCILEDIQGYQDMILVRNIPFYSHCEHHMLPFFGKAHIAYYPGHGIVGLSKIARVVDIFARRLQNQERLTVQISEAMTKVLRPRGVAVMLTAEHMCMSMRGVNKRESATVTSHFSGIFHEDPAERSRFLQNISLS
jgi:GTP cyclohydrolase I